MADTAHQLQGNGLTVKAVAPAADTDEAVAFRFQRLRAKLAAVRRAADRLRRRADGRALHTPYIYLVRVLRERRRGAEDKKKRQIFHGYKNGNYSAEIIHESGGQRLAVVRYIAGYIGIPCNKSQKKSPFFCGREGEVVWNTWDSYTYRSSAQVYV